MNKLLLYFILIPLIGYIVNFLTPRKKESNVFGTAIITVMSQILLFIILIFLWFQNGFADVYYIGSELYHTDGYEFSIDLFFDKITAVYFAVSSILTFLVMIFSKYYMHREKGFKRFFNNVLFFYLGLSFILFSGNFETLFVGWEIIGMASFLLIGFYRDRYLPVKNALKVVSVYRIADVFLLFGIWLCHHYFNKNINFLELKTLLEQNGHIITEEPYKTLIPIIFLVVAAVKSAQFPFSSWLPRAMEGPTTSSAIFYGSVSVHIGVFLMLRTYPIWEGDILFKVILVTLGVLTSIFATFTARVQSSIKTQIAYASIAQIGIMFVEVALGFHNLALFHFASNAFLRTYQLLVSPSVLSYLIHDQFFNFITPKHNIKDNLLGRIKVTIYMLSIKEWNMDSFMYNYLWKPLKTLGNNIRFINAKTVLYLFTPLYVIGLYFAYHKQSLPSYITGYFPLLIASISLLMILKAFTKRSEASKSWFLIIVSQLYMSLSISFNEQFEYTQLILYLSGIAISSVIGYICFNILNKHNESITLDRFHGHSYEHPRLAVIFLVACLGLAGFPITPTFIGEDVILGHIHENQFLLTFIISLSIILDGLSIFRIYSRLFLGSHNKGYHEKAYRSS
jgi:NADH-quinone oxidoreductase subunit L